jgi:antitoxin component of MazEF toxin-antitoxin module
MKKRILKTKDKTKRTQIVHKTLKELVKGITKKNRHPQIDWGPDVGREILDPW